MASLTADIFLLLKLQLFLYDFSGKLIDFLSIRELEAPERTCSPPLAFQNNRSVMRPSYLSAAVHR